RFLSFVIWQLNFLEINGDEMIPSIIQPSAANGGSVQPLIPTLLTLKATIAAMPLLSKERVCASARAQFCKACHKDNRRSAMNTIRTGRPAIAPISRYESWGCARGTYCAGTRYG